MQRKICVRTFPEKKRLLSGRSATKSNFAQVGTEYTYSQIDMNIKGSPDEMQTSTHMNVIGFSMIAPLHVLSPSSVLPPLSSHYAITPAKKITALFKNLIF
jgi:hypothetical protein